MSETQIGLSVLAICLSIIIPVSMLIYSNSRVTDAKETLRAEMALGFERLSRQIDELKKSIESKVKDHELEHH